MKELIEEREDLFESSGVLTEANNPFAQGKMLLDKGIMPDGEKWKAGKPPVTIGMNGDVIVSGVKKKPIKDGVEFTFKLRLAPGKGGGAGATIPAAASNHFFNLVGTDSKSIAGLSKAFLGAVKGNLKGINTHLTSWFRKPENWVWRVVGYPERESWAPNVGTLKFKKVNVLKPMVDPTRRKWPAGRTEIWAPLEFLIQVQMKNK